MILSRPKISNIVGKHYNNNLIALSKLSTRIGKMKLLISSSPFATVVLDSDGKVNQIFADLDDAFLSGLKEKTSPDIELVTDSQLVFDMLRANGIRCQKDVNHTVLRDWRMNRFEKLMESTGLVSDIQTYHAGIRDFGTKISKSRVKKATGKRDELAAQIIHSIDDLQKSENLVANRLEELYGLHFPELVDYVNNPVTLAKIIKKQSNRNLLTSTDLQEFNIPQEKIEAILSSVNESVVGIEDPDDLIPIQNYAVALIGLNKQKRTLEEWIDIEMTKIAPNITAVAGPNVAARLISAIGSLRSLAMKASSKIQTVGAEKALYSALRGRGSPPKHGMIFQIPEIGNSPYWIRGKLSRAYASKIALAARLDEFDGELLGPQMRQHLRELEANLREKFPTAPIKPVVEGKKSASRRPPRKGQYRRKRR